MDWKSVGEAIENRIAALNMKHVEVVARSGMSDPKVRQMRRGVDVNYRPTTVQSIEQALLWAPGSIEAIGNGGEPVVVSPSPQTIRGKIRFGHEQPNGGTTPVEASTGIIFDTHEPSTRIAMAADEMSAAMTTISKLLSSIANEIDDDTPVAEVAVSRIKLEGLNKSAGEFQASLDELLTRINQRVHTDL